ncbi:hypothetical protein [Hyalangium versicolor]|uniref:hypothetical protein n=1 Tax=Hyalangium versicolor TaxID=2861190 RepID=UPI001CC934C1|nr:hypothetical protein [Hyalangium versicolor]
MNRLYRSARALDVRRPSAVVLFALLAHVAACQPEPVSEAEPASAPSPIQPGGISGESATPPRVDAASYFLTSLPPPSPGSGDMIRGKLTTSSFGGPDFRYDAYVVTARKSGTVRIQSNVLESQLYPYGYAYPIELLDIDEGFQLTAWACENYQNALDTGTAILDQRVVAGRQYILLYKTFTNFTPLTYHLTVSPLLKVEGQIHVPLDPASVPPSSPGLITLENPRPDVLDHFMIWLNDWTSL